MRLPILLIAATLALAGCNQPSGSETADTSIETSDPDAPQSFCPELQRMVSEADCTLARELVANAETGIAAFNAPSPMTRGKEETLQLVIALAPPAPPTVETPVTELPPGPTPTEPDPTPDPIPEPIEPPPPPPPTPAETVDPLPGKTVEFNPVVGRHMAAELTGDGFEITARSPRAQDILPDSQTSWEWTVTPRRKGPLTLTLKTFVEAEFADGKRYPLRSLTTNQTIEVAVTPLDRVADFLDATPVWLKRVTAVIAALTALFAAWFAFRKLFRKPVD